jgi:hypothetical protein
MDVLIALALATTTLGVPGRANASASVAATGATVAVVWAASAPDGATDVYAATSVDAARTFAAPVRVNDVAGDARISGEQPPRVALVARRGQPPSIVVVWTTKGASGTKLLQSRSNDGGRTFAHAVVVPGGDAAGNRGWEAIAVDRDGVDALWLDHREMTSHEGHMSPQQSKLYFAPLDGSAAARPLTAGVCYCCKTALATGPDGSLYAAWRHVYPGNLRDIAFTMSRDQGRQFTAPVRVSEDHWMLEGCPDDGPAIAVDRAGRVHVVWPTLVRGSDGEQGIALFRAMTADGIRFTSRQQIPTAGTPHHPQIAVRDDGTLALAWDESKSGTRQTVVVSATVDKAGTAAFGARTTLDGSPAIYPAIAATPDAVVVARTIGSPDNSMIEINRIR